MEHLRPVPAIPKKPPKPKANKKMIALAILFFIIIFVLLFFHSSLNKISVIEIEGYRFLTEDELREKAGVQLDAPFFQTRVNDVAERILELEQVERVEVTKHFPGRIHILVHEYPHVAYEYGTGQLTAVLSNGMNVSAHGLIPDKPLLSGWEAYPELKAKLTDTLANIPHEWLHDVSEIFPAPSSSYDDRIIFYSRTSFEVVTTIEKLPEKLSYFDDIVSELLEKGTTTGRIVMLEADNHEPFELDEEIPEVFLQ